MAGLFCVFFIEFFDIYCQKITLQFVQCHVIIERVKIKTLILAASLPLYI